MNEESGDESNYTHSMAYASRMQYLAEGDRIKPETLFMSRKTAQKLADQKFSTTSHIKVKIGNSRRTATNHPLRNHRGSPNLSAPKQDDAQWTKRFQAGCYFLQNEKTGECKPAPKTVEEVEDDGDLSFPDAFKILDQKGEKKNTKIELLEGGVYPEEYKELCPPEKIAKG